MIPIFSSTALKTRQREVKDAARHDVVHITENGNGAFVFCWEAIFNDRLQQAAENAAYEERMAAAVREGKADVLAGRAYEGTDAAFEEIDRLRGARD